MSYLKYYIQYCKNLDKKDNSEIYQPTYKQKYKETSTKLLSLQDEDKNKFNTMIKGFKSAWKNDKKTEEDGIGPQFSMEVEKYFEGDSYIQSWFIEAAIRDFIESKKKKKYIYTRANSRNRRTNSRSRRTNSRSRTNSR